MIARPAMRFCPFCAQDNPDDARECVHCGKRLACACARARRPSPAPPQAGAAASGAAAAAAARAVAGAADDGRGGARTKRSRRRRRRARCRRSGRSRTRRPGRCRARRTARPSRRRATRRSSRTPRTPRRTRSMRRRSAPKPSAPTGTLLGIPAQEIPGSLMPAAHADSEQRTTKPLSLADVAKQARKRPPEFDDDDDDAQTAVQAPATIVDDLPTSRNPQGRARGRRARADDGAPGAALAPDRSRASADAARRACRPSRRCCRRPGRPRARRRDAWRRRRPAARNAVPGADAADQLPSGNLPDPLPPPPSRVGNDAGAFPAMDVGPTPAIPTLALPPMPEHPKSGSIVDAVKYLLPLGKAIWARKKAQDAIRTLAPRRPAPARQRRCAISGAPRARSTSSRRPSPTRCASSPPTRSAAPPPTRRSATPKRR